MPITAQNATPDQIERRLTEIQYDIRYWTEIINIAPESREAIAARAKRAELRRLFSYFHGLYKKKGGKAMLMELPPDRISAVPPQVRERRERIDAQKRVQNLIQRCEVTLVDVKSGLDRSQKTIRDRWWIDMLFYQAGGFSSTTLHLARSRGLVPAQRALENARRMAANGDYDGAIAQLRVCLNRLDIVAKAVNGYIDAKAIGGKRIEIAIQIGASIGTGMAVQGSGLTLSAGEKASAAALQTGTQGAGAVLADGNITAREFGKAQLDAALAGGSTFVGAWAKDAVAPKVAGLLFENPTPTQMEEVQRIVESYFTANSGIAIQAFRDAASGKDVSFSWWASLVSPALATAGSALGTGDAIVRKSAKNEEAVAKMLESRARGSR